MNIDFYFVHFPSFVPLLFGEGGQTKGILSQYFLELVLRAKNKNIDTVYKFGANYKKYFYSPLVNWRDILKWLNK